MESFNNKNENEENLIIEFNPNIRIEGNLFRLIKCWNSSKDTSTLYTLYYSYKYRAFIELCFHDGYAELGPNNLVLFARTNDDYIRLKSHISFSSINNIDKYRKIDDYIFPKIDINNINSYDFFGDELIKENFNYPISNYLKLFLLKQVMEENPYIASEILDEESLNLLSNITYSDEYSQILDQDLFYQIQKISKRDISTYSKINAIRYLITSNILSNMVVERLFDYVTNNEKINKDRRISLRRKR